MWQWSLQIKRTPKTLIKDTHSVQRQQLIVWWPGFDLFFLISWLNADLGFSSQCSTISISSLIGHIPFFFFFLSLITPHLLVYLSLCHCGILVFIQRTGMKSFLYTCLWTLCLNIILVPQVWPLWEHMGKYYRRSVGAKDECVVLGFRPLCCSSSPTEQYIKYHLL